MGYQAKKTEHTGAKHGNGAYWGPKQHAKKESNKRRRRADRELAIAEEWMSLEDTLSPKEEKLIRKGEAQLKRGKYIPQ